MAIDAATHDATTALRPVQRERSPSPIINDGHNGGGVEIRGEMSFWDFLDVINPLQHIPVVGHLYREITGDTIQPSSKVMGGMLFGGPLGGMASIANAVIEEAQGKDIGDQVMASLGFGGDAHPVPAMAVAARAEDPATAGSSLAPALEQASARPAASADQPIRLTGSAVPPSGGAMGAQVGAQLAAQQMQGAASRDALAAGDAPRPSRMPARDTILANTTLAKHAVPKHTAPLPGSTVSAAQTGAPASPKAEAQDNGQANAGQANAASANGPVPVSPDMLSETMMRNLAKYEQSRKAARPAAPNLRVSS